MDFRTIIDIPKVNFDISHNNKCLFLGSCFAENIGDKLIDTKIPTSINPTGILYNPLSIKKAIENAISGRNFCEKDIFFANGQWNSYDFHSKFSCNDKKECLAKLNRANKELADNLKECDVILITWGTAYVYEINNAEIVCNCHKMPEKTFSRRLITVSEIVDNWTICLNEILSINPQAKIIFTVSPIRHWRDGAHQNQISKSTLHVAINELNAKFDNTTYFPSYEIMNDELRDYRFYDTDMIHSSKVAENYIFERFCDTYFNSQTKSVIAKISKIVTAANHSPFNPEANEYKIFCRKNLEEIASLQQLFTEIDFSKEKQIFEQNI